MTNIRILKTPDDITGMENILKTHHYILIKASATWCKPCKKIETPFTNLIKNKLDDKVKVMYVDVDTDDDVVKLFNINKVPTFISIVKGKVANNHFVKRSARVAASTIPLYFSLVFI